MPHEADQPSFAYDTPAETPDVAPAERPPGGASDPSIPDDGYQLVVIENRGISTSGGTTRLESWSRIVIGRR